MSNLAEIERFTASEEPREARRLEGRGRPMWCRLRPRPILRDASLRDAPQDEESFCCTFRSALAFGELPQSLEITADQRFFLSAGPAFDLTLGRDRVRDLVEPFRVHERYRPPPRGVSAEVTAVVLGDALFKRPSRRANIIAPISTSQNVQPSAARHRPPSCFETHSLRECSPA